MIIVFGNQKGGAGKSTLCALLANYLAIEKQLPVLVLDMDNQGSLVNMRERDKMYQEEMPYGIEAIPIGEYAHYRKDFKATEGYILMDLPGTLNDNRLKPIIQDADYIVCPFRYDFVSFVSTLDFTEVVSECAPKRTKNKEIFYIPNMVKPNVNYEQMTQANETLSETGQVTKAITDRVTLQRIQTFAITQEQKAIVESVFDFIYQSINKA